MLDLDMSGLAAAGQGRNRMAQQSRTVYKKCPTIPIHDSGKKKLTTTKS